MPDSTDPQNAGLLSRTASPGNRSQEPSKKSANEEPELALEPDLPTDGRDEQGEDMIRDLPQRPELTEPPSQPDPSSLDQ